MKPRRGEIWWARLGSGRGSEIKKTRPCLVIGANVLNDRRRTVVMIPLSTSPQAAPPLLVPIVCAGRHAVAVVDQVRAVAKERLESCIGELSTEDLKAVEAALGLVLEL
jgi:mRNA interferase MazF